MPPLSSSQSVNTVSDFLKRISYKPGWKIHLHEERMSDTISVICTYEGYESENAAFDPICLENSTVSGARERLAISIGKTVRKRTTFRYYRSFSRYHFEVMKPEDIIREIIGGTIREAEMYEYERWFKFDGVPVFESQKEKR